MEVITANRQGDPKDEYLDISTNLRHWAQIRFAQMTLFVAITAGILAALFQAAAPLSTAGQSVFKTGALIITGIFWLLDQRAILFWRRLRDRAIELEEVLAFRQYSDAPKAGYLNSVNVVRGLYLTIAVFWFLTLIWAARF